MHQLANTITSIRIICSIALLFCAVLSPFFYVLYILAGLTDIADGWVARKTNTTSEFGAKLDAIADFIFFVIAPSSYFQSWTFLVGFIVGQA